MKTFYSVDVESTSTNPFSGQLLSIGIVPIDAATLEVEQGIHIPVVYDSDGPIDPETYSWWRDQTTAAYDAAWGDADERFDAVSAANQIIGFVKARSAKWEDSIFCANPVSFDFPWIQKLFAEASSNYGSAIDIPFHYRTLCMRSMYFGIVGGDWGQSRSAGNWNYPKLPHHALHDAQAQALDLVKMMMMTHSELRPSQTNTAEAVTDVYD